MNREEVEEIVREFRMIPTTILTAGISGAVAIGAASTPVRIVAGAIFAITIIREAVCQWIEITGKGRK